MPEEDEAPPTSPARGGSVGDGRRPPWSAADTRILAACIGLFLALRLPNLARWLLANLDEIALLNNLSLPPFAGGYGSTTFFPAVQITQLFSWAGPFPGYRYLGVGLNALGLVAFYAALRRLGGTLAAACGAALFALQWYLVYVSRIYEIATFIPPFFALVFALAVRWLTSGRRPVWLVLAFLAGGIGADCYAPPMVYSLGALGLLVAWEAARGRISWRVPLLCAAAFFVAVLPFFYVQLFVGNFVRDVLFNYQYAGQKMGHVVPIHFVQPGILMKTFGELVTTIDLEHKWWRVLAALAVAVVGATTWAAVRTRRDDGVRFVLAWTLLTLLLVVASPVAAYIQGHLTGFLVLFLALLALLVSKAKGPPRWVAVASAGIVVACSAAWLPAIGQDQYAQVAWLGPYLDEEAGERVPVSDGAFLALVHTPFLSEDRIRVFTCDTADHIADAIRPMPCDRPGLVVATFDCDIATPLEAGCLVVDDVQRVTTLVESHLANGVVLYRTRPRDASLPLSRVEGG